METTIEQFNIGDHISSDFDDHHEDSNWRLIDINVKKWIYSTMTLELLGLLIDTQC
jgi:hypothetical protein